jgi:branched-chain amino acid transport system substrate-binding protein
MRKNARIAIVAALLVAVTVFASQCARRGEQSDQNMVKVGAILPLTGPVAVFGDWHQKGMTMAMDEINSRPGARKVQVIFEDSKADAKEGVTAFNKLVNVDKTAVVVTALSRVSLPLIPLAEQSQVPLFLTDVTYPKVTERSPWLVRYFLSSDVEARAIAAYAKDRLNINDMALLYVNDEAGSGGAEVLRTEFTGRGGRVTGEDTYELTDTDMRNRLDKLLSVKPQALWIYGLSKAVGIAVKQARESGYKGTILANQAMAFPEFRGVAGDAAEGVYFTTPDVFSLPINADFKRRYTERWKSEPGLEALYGYDIIRLIYSAASTTDDRNAIRANLSAVKNFDGSFGKISVGENRDIPVPVAVGVIKNGAAQPADTAASAAGQSH